MTPQLLESIGLTKSQAKTYLVLVEKGRLTPPEVSVHNGESRSNTYMILQKLERLGLVQKLTTGSKVTYQPTSPVALENLAEERRRASVATEQQIKHFMPHMLSYFYSFTEKPGIRMLQGVEGVKEIYTDVLRTKQDVYFLRTTHDVRFMGEAFYERYKKRRAALGIKTYAFTPRELGRHTKDDAGNKMMRTWVPADAYRAPVEVNVYGDKVAFMVFGEEIMGVIVQSTQIAECMRQMFGMIKTLYA